MKNLGKFAFVLLDRISYFNDVFLVDCKEFGINFSFLTFRFILYCSKLNL